MPLSEYEQRVLDQLEAQLASEDPVLGSRLASPAAPRRTRVALGVSGVVVGLSGLVLGLVVSLVWISLIAFLAMFAGAYFALTSPKTGRIGRDQEPLGKAKPHRPGLSERFQKRFDGTDGAF
ncbi:MAG: DUF3040 domain-containing protein [Bifidobacteriaceae bacterium]|jgi:hypothetical protein|nr:DUF3040 domain-containing protein [Bifidobacteriaceae bacterium]